MDWNWDRLDDEDDEDNEEGGSWNRWQFGTRDGLIFLIDCTKLMFERVGEESHFELCIKCAKNLIQNKIISSDKDLLGIVFFGTKEAKNPSELKHIYIFHELGQPGAERVLQLEDLLEEPDNNDFQNTFGDSDAYSLHDALWACSTMFSNCSQKLGYKRVMLFTNNDNPHRNSAHLKTQAAAKAKDLHENGIGLELMHMSLPDRPFDVEAFYKDILFSDDDDSNILPDPAEKFEELLTRVRSKDHKKRALSRLEFSLGPGLDMSVGVYNLARSCTKPASVKLFKKTNEEVKSVTKSFLTENAEILLPSDLKKSQVYGGKQISFEPEEVTAIKRFDNSGFKLMGFKPRSCVKKYYHIKPAQFIYPDESTIEGSTCMFTAMLKKCLDKDVVAICRMIPRRNTPPRFVALVPQDEELDEHNVQVAPPGFHVLWLPYADDFRKIKCDQDLPRANTEQIDKAKEIVKKLQFTFRSDSFENPALQHHYANVEAMALDRDAPEEVTDYTLPDNVRIDKRAGNLLEEFKDLVYPEGYDPTAKKRGAAAAKRVKVEAVDIDVEKEARAGKLAKLTVPVLKEYVKTAHITANGTRKADLMDAILDHFGLK